MKAVGIVLIAVGIALIIFISYGFIREKNTIISPIPENKGVRVIFVSPPK